MRTSEASNRLRQVMDSEGLKVRDFSERAGVTVRSVQNYLSGERHISATLLESMSERMGISADWVLTGRGDMRLSQHPASAAGVREDVLLLAIESIEEALAQLKKTMRPQKKAELVVAVYDLYADAALTPQTRSKVLKFVKLAA